MNAVLDLSMNTVIHTRPVYQASVYLPGVIVPDRRRLITLSLQRGLEQIIMSKSPSDKLVPLLSMTALHI